MGRRTPNARVPGQAFWWYNSAEMDRDTLLQHVRAALGLLYQEPLLHMHPLAELLVPQASADARGAALKRVLLEAMQQLRPPHATAYHSPAWRRYRSLFQHYLEGKSFEEIAEEQGISSRQARRDHHEAIEVLGDILWAQYCRARETSLSGPGRTGTEPATAGLSGSNHLLEAELRRLDAYPTEEPTSFEETLQSATQVVRRLAEVIGTTLELALPEALPPVAANRTVLRQALLSLLSYAVEPCPGGRVTVTAASAPHGVDLHIVASDWRGPPPASPDESERLAVSRRLLEAQGGALEMRVSNATCVSFRLSLPAKELPTVLVVDDNPDVPRLFQRYLGSASYRLLQATTAQTALRLAREARPRVITLDLMMPSQDGWELLQVLKRDRETAKIPVVVCSVLQERALAMALGASHFLPKPITQAALLAVLEQCCAGPPAGPPGSSGDTA